MGQFLKTGKFLFGSRFLQLYFIIGSFILAGLFFIYSRILIRQLAQETQVRSRIYARYMSQVTDPEQAGSPELDIIFEEVIEKIDFPVIVTYADGGPPSFRNIGERNPSPERLKKLAARLDSENPPIPIVIFEGDSLRKLGEIHYGLSKATKMLRIYPFFQIAFLLAFLLLGVWGILIYKRREIELIWTTLAKETAHQLATPLSSFSGWLETIKQEPKVEHLREMEEDLKRMNEIVERFSRIGLPPDVRTQHIKPVIEKTVSFVQRRSPKRIRFSLEFSADPLVQIDDVLFSWTLENLLKNGVDAIGNNEGEISVATSLTADGNRLLIEITDTGPGITPFQLSQIFKPGVTSKKYGWGVGLTLAKRIVEEYHCGRLLLKESRPGRTVFLIRLPIIREAPLSSDKSVI